MGLTQSILTLLNTLGVLTFAIPILGGIIVCLTLVHPASRYIVKYYRKLSIATGIAVCAAIILALLHTQAAQSTSTVMLVLQLVLGGTLLGALSSGPEAIRYADRFRPSNLAVLCGRTTAWTMVLVTTLPCVSMVLMIFLTIGA